MVIYGEYLFLENFIMGGMILHLTGTLSGVKPTKVRLILGSVSCGLYAFLLFVSMKIWWALTAKLAFSLVIVMLVFGGRSGQRAYGKLVLLFYFISFAMGGITIGLMYFFEVTGISQNGAIYMGNAGYGMILCTGGAAYVMLTLIIDWMRSILQESRTTRRVNVGLDGRSTELLGLLDTGNFLEEPISGRPVFLLSTQALPRLFTLADAEILQRKEEPEKVLLALAGSNLARRMKLIPYQAVGTSKGMLLGIRPDYIEFKGEEKGEKMENVVLAIYHGSFGNGFAGEPYSILLHPEMEKGGLVSHG